MIFRIFLSLIIVLFCFRISELYRLQRRSGIFRNKFGKGHYYRMNTSQIQCCINCDPILKKHVVGVFAADRLPFTIHRFPCGFIANTDNYSKPGMHWCGFYFDRPGHGEFFDSYGKTPSYYNSYFSRWLNEHSKHVSVCKKQVQSNNSSVCGLYCLFYLHQRLIGHSLNQILNMFDPVNLHRNDYFIRGYMSNTYAKCITNECVYNQTCTALINI